MTVPIKKMEEIKRVYDSSSSLQDAAAKLKMPVWNLSRIRNLQQWPVKVRCADPNSPSFERERKFGKSMYDSIESSY